jgi:hypothetical protein
MTNTDVVNTIVQITQDYLAYLMPVIAVLSGISLVLSMFYSILLGLGRRTFKG